MSARLQRRYLSLWLRRLATDRLRGSAPGEDAPLVVTALVKSALRIVAMNDAAQHLGLRLGMPLADARAMYPALAVAESDEHADRRLLDTIADWCDRWIISGVAVRGTHGTTEIVGRALRLFQSGSIQTYAFLLVAGVALVLYIVLAH